MAIVLAMGFAILGECVRTIGAGVVGTQYICDGESQWRAGAIYIIALVGCLGG